MVESGPTWTFVITIAGSLIMLLVSIVIALIGTYAKGLGHRLDTLEKAHLQLNNKVLREYHNKDEIRQLLEEIRNQLEKLDTKLDSILMTRSHQ